ncbi:MAG: peptide ABC transporter substrate-binding protein [Candidatus Rokuibacteriota bacterium]|nr:MAG: peptide ABC transporter substrate-binding protein [Candidatus Rokubacteria bacterium]
MRHGTVLMEVQELSKSYPVVKGFLRPRQVGEIRAVDHVSFSIQAGETLGIVGESGSGKTTLGKLILGLLAPTAGKVLFEGQNIFELGPEPRRQLRRQMQVIYQDPFSSLNPRMTIGNAIAYPMKMFGLFAKHDRLARVIELLERVGLNPDHANRFPHEFSGGQRQRIGIARALALNPKFIILDEPVSALDVSIQAQILNLLRDLQAEFHLTYLFIANNLNVVEYLSDRVGVMYHGRVVELASSERLYRAPQHPLTQNLLSSILNIDATSRDGSADTESQDMSAMQLPSGCRYRLRCNRGRELCAEADPILGEVEEDHWAACHFPGSK